MHSRSFGLLGLGVLTLAVGYAAFAGGGGDREPWIVTLLIVGAGGIACASGGVAAQSRRRADRAAIWMAVLLPAYVAIQLAPLPVTILRGLSPARADLAEAVAAVTGGPSLAPITVGASRTWVHLSRVAVFTIVFLVAGGVAVIFKDRPWLPAVPLMVLGGAQAVYGLFHLSEAVPGITGTYASKDHFAGLLAMILPFTALYAVSLWRAEGSASLSRTLRTGAALSAAVAIYAAVAFSLSRMAFISMHVSLFVIAAIALRARMTGWRKGVAVTAVGLAVLLAFALVSPHALVDRFGGLADDSRGRWLIWLDTLRLIADYPAFGVGLGNYFPGLLKYQTSELTVTVLNAHNDYLQLIAELGVIGFMAAAVFLVLVMAKSMRAALGGINRDVRLVGLAAAGGLTAILCHSLADFNLYIPANAMALSWIAGIVAVLPVPGLHGGEKRSMSNRPARRMMYTLGSFVTVYALGWIGFLQFFSADVRAEPMFCMVGICDAAALEAGRQRLHGVGGVGRLPPAEVADLLERDPAGPYRWCDMGDAMLNAGRPADARYCYLQAIRLGPQVPFMLFRAAKFWFDLGDYSEGLRLMARAVEADPAYAWSAFLEYDTRQIPMGDVLRLGLPGQPAAQGYLRKKLSENNPGGAAAVWVSLLANRWVDDGLAAEYVKALIGQQAYAVAAQAWGDYIGQDRADYLVSNYVFNGDFERDLRIGPFDWRFADGPGVTVRIDSQLAHSGRRSARIRFAGTENVAVIDLTQAVFVPPGRYKFQAHVKSAGLTTDQGVLFGLSGTAIDVATESISAATDWQFVEQAFEVPHGGLVQVRLFRRPSLKFANRIEGTVWIDQVQIVPLASAAGKAVTLH